MFNHYVYACSRQASLLSIENDNLRLQKENKNNNIPTTYEFVLVVLFRFAQDFISRISKV